jgi:hypothetical protein
LNYRALRLINSSIATTASTAVATAVITAMLSSFLCEYPVLMAPGFPPNGAENPLGEGGIPHNFSNTYQAFDYTTSRVRSKPEDIGTNNLAVGNNVATMEPRRTIRAAITLDGVGLDLWQAT